MDLISIFLIGVALSMDAAAVSLAKGMCIQDTHIKQYAVKLALFFGLFQAIMPLIGYFGGTHFASYIQNIDHWIAFVLLSIIGFNMLKESNEQEECGSVITHISYKDIILLAIATSIDALAVGVSFAFLKVDIYFAITIIGVTTFTLSFLCVFMGKKLGSIFQKYAERLGGSILVLLGIKILIEHLFF